jgi:hypothetical protein
MYANEQGIRIFEIDDVVTVDDETVQWSVDQVGQVWVRLVSGLAARNVLPAALTLVDANMVGHSNA